MKYMTEELMNDMENDMTDTTDEDHYWRVAFTEGIQRQAESNLRDARNLYQEIGEISIPVNDMYKY